MKYCPNPACPTLLRRRARAEFLDRATSCNDCGAPLAAEGALTAPQTLEAVAAFQAAQREAEDATEGDAAASAAPGRVELATGIALIALSAVLLLLSWWVAESVGKGPVYLAAGPFLYGTYRIERGLSAKRLAKRAS